ncbi:hypothetical protein AGMMS50229_13860 [Campylobacterota bacterium]|nr:hypothetical protein AGMMS50229_13860 [Campylobacterota bacterium]
MADLPALCEATIDDRFLDKESRELSMTLIRIEELLEQKRLLESSETIARAQAMVLLLQDRIDRLHRLSR